MIKNKFDGGVASVRVIDFPMGMKDGGDLSEPPPKGLKPFKGFKKSPNQFQLPQEEKVIPSEPKVIPQVRGNTFPFPVPRGVMPSEPEVKKVPGADRLGEGMQLEERLFNTPTIDPREVYPRDPDPFIQGFFDPMPQSTGGIPNLLQANMLKPAGILDIKKSYDI